MKVLTEERVIELTEDLLANDKKIQDEIPTKASIAEEGIGSIAAVGDVEALDNDLEHAADHIEDNKFVNPFTLRTYVNDTFWNSKKAQNATIQNLTVPQQLTALNTTLNGNHATINAPLTTNSTVRMNGETTIVGDLNLGGNQRISLGNASFSTACNQVLSIGQNTTTTYGSIGLLLGSKNSVSGDTGTNFILAGTDNRMTADDKNAYCYVLGTSNQASAVGAFIFGSNNKITYGEYNAAIGVGNYNGGTASLVVGDNNTNSTAGALVCGTRNNSVTDGLFVVGNGYQDIQGTTIRQNIMEVTRTSFKVDTNNTTGTGITLKAGTSTNTSAPVNIEGGTLSLKARSSITGNVLNLEAKGSSSAAINLLGGNVNIGTHSNIGTISIGRNDYASGGNNFANVNIGQSGVVKVGSSGNSTYLGPIATGSTNGITITNTGNITATNSSSSGSIVLNASGQNGTVGISAVNGGGKVNINAYNSTNINTSMGGIYLTGQNISLNANATTLSLASASTASFFSTKNGPVNIYAGNSYGQIYIGGTDHSNKNNLIFIRSNGGSINVNNGPITLNTNYNGINIGHGNSLSTSRSYFLIGSNLKEPSTAPNGNNNNGNIVFGNHNKPSADYNDLLVVGNGLNIGDTTNGNNALRLTGDGYLYYSTGCGEGADYAEFYEWSDGNPDAEDRIGVFVTFDFDKEYNYKTAQELPQIKIAQPGDYIVGVISGNPAFVGNSDEDWKKRWLYDEFDRPIIELIEVPITELKEVETGEYYTEIEYDENDEEVEVQKPVTELKEVETGEMRTQYVQVLNPDYDPSLTYKSRFDRPEWSTACMLGNISMKDDGTCLVGHYCKCGIDGVATYASERGFDTFLVTRRISDNIIKIIYK